MRKNIFIHFFFKIPPVTRILNIFIAVIMFTTMFKWIDKTYFGLSYRYFAFGVFPSTEFLKSENISFFYYRVKKLGCLLCRIFFTPLYFGKPNINACMHIMFFNRYSSMLEEDFLFTSDYVFLIFLCYVFMIISSLFFSFNELGSSFASIITYIWTKKNPHALIQTYAVVTFQAFYLPFIMPIFTLVSENAIGTEEIMGMVCGHFIFFLKEVFPLYSSDILRTPCFLHKLFNEEQDCCKGLLKVNRFDFFNVSRENTITTNNVAPVNE